MARNVSFAPSSKAHLHNTVAQIADAPINIQNKKFLHKDSSELMIGFVTRLPGVME